MNANVVTATREEHIASSVQIKLWKLLAGDAFTPQVAGSNCAVFLAISGSNRSARVDREAARLFALARRLAAFVHEPYAVAAARIPRSIVTS